MTSKRTTVFLHGFTQTGRSWQPVLDRLPADRATMVVAPDLPGHGANGDKSLNLRGAARLFSATYGPASWVGYSLGGRLALHIALAHPETVERLVLIGASPGIEDREEREARQRADEALADSIERDGVKAFLDGWMAQPLFASLSPEAADVADRRRNTAVGLAGSLRRAGTGAQESLWPRLAELGETAIPTLVLAGERDEKFRTIGARIADAAGPHAAFETVPDAGHAAHLEQPEWVAKRIDRFLAATEETATEE